MLTAWENPGDSMRVLALALVLLSTSASAAVTGYEFEAANGYYIGRFTFDTDTQLWSFDLVAPYGHFTDTSDSLRPSAQFDFSYDALHVLPPPVGSSYFYGPVTAYIPFPIVETGTNYLQISFYSRIDLGWRDETLCPLGVDILSCPIEAFSLRDSPETFVEMTRLEAVPEPGLGASGAALLLALYLRSVRRNGVTRRAP